MDKHGGMTSTQETPNSSTRALWQFYQQSHLAASRGEREKGMMNFALQNIFVHTCK
jgi:hypothetical protein